MPRVRVSWFAMEGNEQAEFQRIEITAKMERARELVVQYEIGLAHYRADLERNSYLLGRLGERLGEAEPEELR